MRSTRRPLTALLCLALLITACSDDGSSSDDSGDGGVTTTSSAAESPSTSDPTTTAAPDPAADAQAYAEAGPHPVGVTTVALADGTPVEVWYPAEEGSSGTDSYDMRDHVPEAVLALLTSDLPSNHTYDAARDAAVADGRYPVVLFSHGFSGIRMQSTFLTSHLASWGMIVVSPEHPSRNLSAALSLSVNRDPQASVDDLTGALDLILAADADAASPFHQHVDSTLVAAVGHSAGGGTVLRAATTDQRVTGYVSMASGVLRGSSGEGTTTTAGEVALPDIPSFFIAGSLDAFASVEETTRPAFEAAPAPSLLWVIEGAGHNAFDDFCTFGGGTGIIGLADASGLGSLLDSFGNFRALGEDGCLPPAVDVELTFPIIQHSVTAWLRALFGIDADPVGLGPEVAGEYATPVIIEQK